MYNYLLIYIFMFRKMIYYILIKIDSNGYTVSTIIILVRYQILTSHRLTHTS